MIISPKNLLTHSIKLTVLFNKLLDKTTCLSNIILICHNVVRLSMCNDITAVASLKKTMNSLPLGKSSILVSVTLIFFLLLLASLGNTSASDTRQDPPDADKDGLSDTLEDTLSTDKNNKFGDKDNDGLYDFEEYLDYYGSNDTTNQIYDYNNATSVIDGLGDLYHLFGLSSNKTGYLRNQIFTQNNGGFTNYLLWNVNFTGTYGGGGSDGVIYDNNVMQNIIFADVSAGGSYSDTVSYRHNVMNNVIYSGNYAGGNIGGNADVSYINNSLVNVIFSGTAAGGRYNTNGQVYYRNNTFSNVIFSGEDAGSKAFGINAVKTNNIILSDNEDTDGDGLGDGWEYIYRSISGVDPRSKASNATLASNTDGDGLNILEEAKAFSSPVSNDTDGDGLNDSYEVDLNTNTQLNDTDGDGLPDGWEVTYSAISGINATDIADESVLGSDMDDMDGLNISEEGKAGTNPTSNDTDGDGLLDAWEVKYYNVNVGVDPLNSATVSQLAGDWENDGLTLTEEGKAGTSPVLRDTDGDGLLDPWEAKYRAAPGVDPTVNVTESELESNTDNDGLTLLEEFNANTDPDNNDTDEDGLPDGWEVTYSAVSGVNATMAANSTELAYDTDNDGLNLTGEFKAGTDPSLNDTDGDGLLDGWEVTYSAVSDIDPLDATMLDLTSDTDRDGLTLTEEVKALTNPILKDTDGDSLTDGYEVEIGTNPLLDDTDGDGLNDSYEVEIDTNPLSNDTDGDGLPDAWEVTYSDRPGVDPRDGATTLELNSDTDRDGLTLTEEFEIGTDPSLNDTDGDGLPDGWEVTYSTISGIDPLDATTLDLTSDTDKDGLNLTEEVKAGTNPEKNDTDGDGLLDPWEAKYRAAPGVDPLTNVTDSELASDTDNDDLTLLQEFEADTDPASKDTDGDRLNDSYELKINTDPLLNDTDGDGLPDGWEVKYNGTQGVNPLIPETNTMTLASDTDKDGLNLTAEAKAFTNPTSNDTDSDGLNDSYELEIRTDPLLNDTDSDGLNDSYELEIRTDPLLNDTDGDDLSDGQEQLTLMTSPILSDTDGDGLSDGWEVRFSTITGVDPLVAATESVLASDTDDDGLSLIEEFKANTDPTLEDTDGDGLPDGWEVRFSTITGVDPLVAATVAELISDTDNDGLSLIGEFKANTDPTSKDTDGDGLPDGWEVRYSSAPGVDPLVAATATELASDTDGDGLTLLEEAEANTDPETADNPMPTSTSNTNVSSGETNEGSITFHVVLTIFAFFSLALVIYRMRRRML